MGTRADVLHSAASTHRIRTIVNPPHLKWDRRHLGAYLHCHGLRASEEVTVRHREGRG